LNYLSDRKQNIELSYRPVIFESPVSLAGAESVCDLEGEADIDLDEFVEDSDLAFDEEIEDEELDDEVMDLLEEREQ
jgi:hypothetical protein